MINKKYLIITFFCFILSLLTGLLTNDLLLGGTNLLTALLCAYFASEGKRSNYILGLINYLISGYISYQNQLYGLFFFYIFVFLFCYYFFLCIFSLYC